jgi:2-dehydro-3-deoxyphosphogluconate aldolase/(4S)-4-hydroxy-2-oxoglutarate aldolase
VTPEEALSLSPVIPVVTIADAAHAVPLAQALLAGGLRTVEITLGTDAALAAIEAIAAATPKLAVGAGTVMSRDDLRRAADAGASYALSPGSGKKLIKAAERSPIPLIPGVATASEIMRGNEHGLTHFKFFPAASLGGPAALAALSGPLPEARFCPTGGIGPDEVGGYLALQNVLCVGGSWIAPPQLIAVGDWSAIEQNARRAARMRR